ncbi:hypothetical protein AM501_19835 [Aneurinibacillus migulanus]|uniref:hypothetical protein n=1 Tax=Aneurinibacillus migulanus TaxID=47500 RepID=UPI0005BCC123|nr:hypothetical protein [Aneurinibacillus migulanus]KIV54469.1 hypothetical protein TS64_15595 [Aneurinibacillus migulanus]KPD06865.1 hypothetical protein AM501_19835 [Aneurinibacillus migulanus]MCP1354120.1 hypothetical protein [Aneurinibacillus migulanus]MED4728083.1 hypothetical protein [Aneurinibacillus migulanus]CEH30061.1 Uncharacterized protein BN1090_A2_02501 [Aneurinibacillus migulanus]
MKLSRKLAAFVLSLGIIGAASASIFTQPDVRADDSALPEQPAQQTASAPAPEQNSEPVASDTYANEAMGFSLRLPDLWIGNYTVEQVEKNIDGFPAVIFSNPKHSFELMEIVKIPVHVWQSEGYDESLYMKLTEQNGTVYAALFPSETLYEGDQEVTEITNMLNGMFQQIKTTFSVTQ